MITQVATGFDGTAYEIVPVNCGRARLNVDGIECTDEPRGYQACREMASKISRNREGKATGMDRYGDDWNHEPLTWTTYPVLK